MFALNFGCILFKYLGFLFHRELNTSHLSSEPRSPFCFVINPDYYSLQIYINENQCCVSLLNDLSFQLIQFFTMVTVANAF